MEKSKHHMCLIICSAYWNNLTSPLRRRAEHLSVIGQEQTPLTAYHTAAGDKLVSELMECSKVNLQPYESHQ